MVPFRGRSSSLVKASAVLVGREPRSHGQGGRPSLTIGMVMPLFGVGTLRDATLPVDSGALSGSARVGNTRHRGSVGRNAEFGTCPKRPATNGATRLWRGAGGWRPQRAAVFPEVLPRSAEALGA